MLRCSLHFATLFNVEVALCKNLEFINFCKKKQFIIRNSWIIFIELL